LKANTELKKILVCIEVNSVDSWTDISEGLRRLKKQFEILEVSSVYTVSQEIPERNVRKGDGHMVVVCVLTTTLTSKSVMFVLQSEAAEVSHSRLDYVLLMYESEFIRTPQLTLPHPALHREEKYLVPATDVWPEATHPVLDMTLQEILRKRPARAWGEFYDQGKSLLDFSNLSQ
jgi:7,8-dihydro-6-hydroxymethylpterin-pyrophosphokinase